MKIEQIVLNTADLAKTDMFYRELLGMHNQSHGIGYASGEAHLAFEHGPDPTALPDEFFWKIGLTLRNLDFAVEYLRSNDGNVSDPRQFRDIGYLAHLRDPSGHEIELLQQGFEGRETDPGNGHPLGGQATLAHLTLRVRDLTAAQSWTEKHQLRLMSVQPVTPYGFTLYFYAWSDEPLPVPDLESVENREWLWARPYTILELQHLNGAGATPAPSPQLVEVGIEQNGKTAPLDLAALNV